MSSSSNEKIAFAPLKTIRYIATENPEPEGIIPGSLETPPQLFWIRCEKGFAKFGFEKKLSSDGHSSPKFNSVGEPYFETNDVIVLTMGLQGTTGYSIAVESIVKEGNEIHFLIKTSELKPKDAVGESLSHPFVTIVVKKLPAKAKFCMLFNGKPTSYQQKILG